MNLMPNVHFNEGQTIFQEGYPAESVYFVCDGMVQIFKMLGNQPFHIYELGNDTVFGEASIISKETNFVTAIASKDTWCYEVNKNFFQNRIKNIDSNVASVLKNLIDTIRKKVESEIATKTTRTDAIDAVFDEIAKINPNRIDFDAHLHFLESNYTQDYLTNNKELLSIIDSMDLVMRKLYFSLINTAYKE